MRRVRSRYAVVFVTLLICQPLFPATIEVNETCTLPYAIAAANNDDDSGGLCPPGGSGADTLVMTGDDNSMGSGLPRIRTDITIEGQGFTIERAFFVDGFREDGDLTLKDSAVISKGGIFVDEGTVTILNSTLSGGSTDWYGGAIYNSYGRVTIDHSTLSGNSASGGGGIFAAYDHYVSMSGSIVANSPSGVNCSATIHGGNNFDSDGSCAGAAPIEPGVDFDTTLADNGGTTLTHALLPGSVAQDAAGECGLETDQRGVSRDDGACDSGAFEMVQGACCTDAPGVASDCIVTDQSVCEVRGGLFLGVGSECRPDIDCVALLVTMQAMSAEAVEDGVLVRWTTAMETDTVGFRVWRQSAGRREKALEPVGPMVPALGSEVEGGSYEVLDDSPAAAGAIHYFIEDIDLFGRVTRHGPIAVDRGVRDRRAIRVKPGR